MREFAAKPKKFNDDDIRDEFQRDRDRILYSKPFRRLSGKTQVFFVGTDDHIRTRLTHTLEVNQIANTISSYLGLNTTLTEAIALGHDIGHAPFGHAGERVLNSIMNGEDSINEKLIKLDEIRDKDKGFKHNLQALRILKDLTMSYKRTYGLDISKKTLWGIVNHSSLRYEEDSKLGFYDRYLRDLDDNEDRSIEALVVKDADEIAQRHHDIEDAIELELIPKKKLLEKIKEVFKEELDKKKMYKSIIKRIEYEDLSKNELITNYSKLIVDLYVSEYIESLENLFMELNEKKEICQNEFKVYDKNNHLKEFCREMLIEKGTGFSIEFKKKDEKFQDFLKNAVLSSQSVQMMDGKGKYIIRKLFQAYFTNPQQMPDKTIKTFLRNIGVLLGIQIKQEDILPSFIRNEIEKYHGDILKEKEENKEIDVFGKFLEREITIYEYKIVLMRTITDYIAGMTDKYALKQYEILYGTVY